MGEPNDLASTTYLALVILAGGAKKIIENKKELTSEEAKSIGSALGFIAFVTTGTEADVLKVLNEAADEAKMTKMPQRKVSDVGDPTALEVSGGMRRGRKKMRGGFPPLMSILVGIVGTIFGLSTGSTLYNLKARQDEVREEALAQLNDACPTRLRVAPAKPMIDWSGEYAALKADYDAKVAVCQATADVAVAKVNAADAALAAAWAKLPNQAQAFSTAAALVTSGPFTPATLGAATAVGAAVRQVVESVVAGALPSKPDELKTFAETIAKGFPAPAAAAAPSPAASAAPAAPTAAPRRAAASAAPAAAAAPEPAAAGAPQGGRRKTRGRKSSKRRTTRRRRVFVPVKFAY